VVKKYLLRYLIETVQHVELGAFMGLALATTFVIAKVGYRLAKRI
jgi:hypothetical protein